MGTITIITGSASLFPERTDTNIRLHTQNTQAHENSLSIANLIASDINHINWLAYSSTTNLALRSIADNAISLLMLQTFYQQIKNLNLRHITSSAITSFPPNWMKQLQGLQLSALDVTAIFTIQKHSFPNLKKLVLHDLDANAVTTLDLQKFPQVTTIKLSLTGDSLTLALDKLKALLFTGKLVAGDNLCDEEKQKINDFNFNQQISQTKQTTRKRAGSSLPGPTKKNRKRLNDVPLNRKQLALRDTLHFQMYPQGKSLLEKLQEQAKSTTSTATLAVGFRPQ